jgi:hypothetical protein
MIVLVFVNLTVMCLPHRITVLTAAVPRTTRRKR